MFSNLVYVIHHIKIALEMDCIPIIDMDNFPTKYNEKKNLRAHQMHGNTILNRLIILN